MLTVFAGALVGTDLGAFADAVGSPVVGDRPLSASGYTSQFFTTSGGRLLVGSDF